MAPTAPPQLPCARVSSRRSEPSTCDEPSLAVALRGGGGDAGAGRIRSTTATTSRSGWPSYGKSGFAVLSLANAAASSAGAGLTVVSTAVGTKGETLTIEPRRETIFECDCHSVRLRLTATVSTYFACG